MIHENIEYGFDYYADAMESMISGTPVGWYAYKEIEWLDFPKIVTDNAGRNVIEQDIASINKLICKLGQFYLELTNDNLRLYAYLKK